MIGMFMNECIDSTMGHIHVYLLCSLSVTIRGLDNDNLTTIIFSHFIVVSFIKQGSYVSFFQCVHLLSGRILSVFTSVIRKIDLDISRSYCTKDTSLYQRARFPGPFLLLKDSSILLLCRDQTFISGSPNHTGMFD